MDSIRVATRKGLFTVEKLGGRWKVTAGDFIGDPVTMVLVDSRDGSAYAALRHGHFGAKLHRQPRAHTPFEEIGTPAYPPKPDGFVDTNASSQKEIPWSLDTVWSLEAGGRDQPGELWCGTIPGGLFHSLDGGRSWSLVSSLWLHPSRKEWFGGGADLPGLHSICVDPRDPARLLVGVSCGGVWLSRDRGQSWQVKARGMHAAYMPPERATDEVIQDPHRMVLCPAAPDVLWVQHHNGIFLSTDGAESWQDLSERATPASFGFATVVHPGDPGRAWFIPAINDERRVPVDGKLVVTRTRDRGETFEVLREGLPQEHAYDIVFRHAFDIDESGEVLAFGTTTGALFVGDQQGDRWECVNAHLPPIYALRFG